MTIEEVVREINQINFENEDDFIANFENEVIIAFGDYEYDGETEVIVSKNPYGGYTWQAYINHQDAPIVLIKANGLKLEAILA